ncbi:hypothetical protein [Sinisalibacter lacisalsi]|uniref:Cell envelope biogenesis protein TolA n=1 Tax=Sinisalibacter lacisalsi TaxID=1526570 RepID=A0ABQ1QTL7_9RHOB|nr:hypothetical protein [Sinisalibacter lacisalsi]GGD45678.1 hypothetical protein GCM10011358_31750 [Sinisalibacter lacisalsi]
MRTGYIISGIGHGLLMLWLLFGGLFLRGPDEPPLRVSEVSLISGAEFAALNEAAQAPRPAPAPSPPETSPAPPRRPAPPAPEPDPEPAAPEPEPEPEPAPPAPEPEPEPEPPAPAPEVTPPAADRVTNEVVEAPEDPLPEGPVLIEESAPAEATEPQAPVEELPAQAPEASTTQIVTEADRPDAAPTSSPRPPRRPDRPAPRPETVEAPAPDPEPAPTPEPTPPNNAAIDSAVNDALADVLGEAAGTPGPSGPPLTSGERDGLRVAVSRCWNLGSASTDALNTTVVVLVQMSRDGRPEGIEMISSNGPTQEATRIAYEAARRAVIRCGTSGYGLPAEKYDQWREIEMTFDPGNMRIR